MIKNVLFPHISIRSLRDPQIAHDIIYVEAQNQTLRACFKSECFCFKTTWLLLPLHALTLKSLLQRFFFVVFLFIKSVSLYHVCVYQACHFST